MKNIFISSTFRDMQAERDLVQERVLPALKEEARKYGDNVGVIDLRWGVDTSTLETDEGSAKVLKVCLDEIDRSHPYMLIFLGERYGWIPDGSLIEKAIKGRGDKYVTDDFEKSVTALEIEYGALSEQYGDLNRCIICLRESVSKDMNDEDKVIYKEESEAGKEKLEALKKRIKAQLGDESRLISYTCKWDEKEHVLKDFTANGKSLEEIITEKYIEMFRADWQKYENLSWQEKEQLVFRALMESKLRTFVGREALLEDYYQKITNATKPIILQGEVGSGKTAIMCKLIDRMQKEGKKVFPFFCGMGSMSKNADALVQQMIYHVETQVGVKHRVLDKEQSDANTFKQKNLGMMQEDAISQYDQNLEYLCDIVEKMEDKIYVFVDALDQLSEDEHVENLDFFFNTKNIQIVASCTDVFEINSANKVRMELWEIPMLTTEDAKRVAEGILRADSRDFFDELENALLAKKNIGSPLYISLLIQRLNMMDKEELAQVETAEEIVAYGVKVIEEMPDDKAETAVAILKKAIHKTSAKPNGLLLEVVRFLAVSRNGLNMESLRDLFITREEEFPVLDFTLLMKYLDGFFYSVEEGRINFTHKVIREGILKEITDKSIYEEGIKEYIKSLKENESLYMQEGMYFARVTRDYEFAVALMCCANEDEPKLLLKAITEEATSDTGEFYSLLLSEKKEYFDAIKKCLMDHVKENLQLSKKEMETKGVLLQNILYYMKELYEKAPSEESLKKLSHMYVDIGNFKRNSGCFLEALEYYEVGLEYAQKLFECHEDIESFLLLFLNLNGIGNVFSKLGQPQNALGYYGKALEHAEWMHENLENENTLSVLASMYSNIGNIYFEMGKLSEALPYYEKQLKYTESFQSATNESPLGDLALACSNIGRIWRDLSEPDKAIIYFEKELMYAKKFYDIQKHENSLNMLSRGYHDWARILCNMNLFEEALDYCKKELKCREELDLSQQSNVSKRALLESYDLMGRILGRLNRYAEALKYYEKMLTAAEDLHVSQQNEYSLRDMYGCYINMGYALREIGNQREALVYYEKALTCAQKLYESQQNERRLKDLRASYRYMGETLKSVGKFNDAIVYYERQLECAEELYRIQQREIELRYLFENYYVFAEGLAEADKETEAIEYYKKSVNCGAKLYKNEWTETGLRELAVIYNRLAEVSSKVHQTDEALAYYEKEINCKEALYELLQSDEVLLELGSAYTNMGHRLGLLGMLEKAEVYFKKSLDGAKQLYKKQRTIDGLKNLFASCFNMAQIIKALRRYEEALRYYEEGIEYIEIMHQHQQNEESLKGLSFSYLNSAEMLQMLGQEEKAFTYFIKSCNGLIELFNTNKSMEILKGIRTCYQRLTEICLRNSAFEEMIEYSSENEHISKSIFIMDKSISNLREYVGALSLHATCLAKLQRIEEFLEYKERVTEYVKILYENTGLESDKEWLDMLENC